MPQAENTVEQVQAKVKAPVRQAEERFGSTMRQLARPVEEVRRVPVCASGFLAAIAAPVGSRGALSGAGRHQARAAVDARARQTQEAVQAVTSKVGEVRLCDAAWLWRDGPG